MAWEQFTNLCPSDVPIFLKELKSRNLEELAQMVELYLHAHYKKLVTKATVTRQVVQDTKLARSRGKRDLE